jgi:hypothetical protein
MVGTATTVVDQIVLIRTGWLRGEVVAIEDKGAAAADDDEEAVGDEAGSGRQR